MRGNPGRVYIVKEGVNKGKMLIAYNKDQEPRFTQAGKVVFWAEVPAPQTALFPEARQTVQEKRLFSLSKLDLMGFID